MQELKTEARPRTLSVIDADKCSGPVDHVVVVNRIQETIPLPAPGCNLLEMFLFGFALATKGAGK